MKRRLRILCILLFVVCFGFPASVRADIAPPEQPPGSNPEPGAELTEVRMVSETVLLDVQASMPKDSLGQARVSADFTMRNLGSAVESMAVRFPLGTNNGFGEISEIENVSIKVNGSLVPTRRVMQTDPVWDSDLVPWVEFDVSFPPNQDVQIQVTYLLEGTGEYPFISFNYVLHTGAGWKDSIGSADLIVRLPYEVSEENMIFDEHTGWSTTTPGGAIQGDEVVWRFEDLEPEQSNDFEVSLVMPSVWQKVLNEQSNTRRAPNDGEAWGRLGKLYKEIFLFRRDYRHDVGGGYVYDKSIHAYEKAVTLLPGDALWHAGFADLLAVHAFYAGLDGYDVRMEMERSMREIYLAQELAPNDEKVKEIAEKIYFFFPDAIQLLESGYDYLWLTATPELVTPTFVPDTLTSPPPSTTTVVPAQEATSTPEPQSPTNPLCTTAWLIPLGLVCLARLKNMLRE